MKSEDWCFWFAIFDEIDGSTDRQQGFSNGDILHHLTEGTLRNSASGTQFFFCRHRQALNGFMTVILLLLIDDS